MRQLYYTIQTLLRGRGSNAVKLISLTLGLLVGILLFSQIVYELNYDTFYKGHERLAMFLPKALPDIGNMTLTVLRQLRWRSLSRSW